MCNDIKNCINDLLIEGTQDDIGAYWIANIASIVGGAVGDDIRKMSLAIIREVLSQGLMEIGDIKGIGYNPNLPALYERVELKPWNLSLAEAMERVGREWKVSVKCPDFGEVCWLVNTAKGDEVAHQLLEKAKRKED